MGSGNDTEDAKVTMRIFIADDSAAVRERLTEMLSNVKDIEIAGQAENGLKAVDSIWKLKPDVVVLDIQMPNGSGIEVLQKIKKKEPAALVIILTNYPYPEYRRECIDAGANFFFDKSMEFEQVMKVVKGLI